MSRGRSVTVVAPPIRGSGPNDWHVVNGVMQPGLDAATEREVLRRRQARAGVFPVDDTPDKAELREKAKALTLAEQELAKARAELEAEREAFEAEKEARASARGGK